MIDIKYYLKCKNVERLNGVFKIKSYNLMEHQWMTAMLFRHFASLEDVSYDINVLDMILNHDMVETITMDCPYPLKNLSKKTKQAWEEIENEALKKNFQLQKYSDENIKGTLTERQFALFKVCDILDLLIFTKQELSSGNETKEMLLVESNCINILKFLKFKFPKVLKFMESFSY